MSTGVHAGKMEGHFVRGRGGKGGGGPEKWVLNTTGNSSEFFMVSPIDTIEKKRRFAESNDGKIIVLYKMSYSDGSDKTASISLKMDGIEGSTLVWENGKTVPVVKKTPGTFEYTERALFQNLPPKNSAFGVKNFTVTVEGKNIKVTNFTKIFYNGMEKNHPPEPGQTAVTPNWYYYWKQFIPEMKDFGYVDSGTCGRYVDDKLYLGNGACGKSLSYNAVWYLPVEISTHPTHKVGTTASGMDCLKVTIAHERQHKKNSDRINVELMPDSDKDGLCDEDEINIYCTREYYNDKNGETPSTDCWRMRNIDSRYLKIGDDEYAARRAEKDVKATEAEKKQDWSSELWNGGLGQRVMGSNYNAEKCEPLDTPKPK